MKIHKVALHHASRSHADGSGRVAQAAWDAMVERNRALR
jgi:hypothetical protein